MIISKQLHKSFLITIACPFLKKNNCIDFQILFNNETKIDFDMDFTKIHF